MIGVNLDRAPGSEAAGATEARLNLAEEAGAKMEWHESVAPFGPHYRGRTK